MDDKEVEAKAILRSKAKILTDRNERFAIISKELNVLRQDINRKFDIFLGQFEEYGKNSETDVDGS